jgi:hypothetical protein
VATIPPGLLITLPVAGPVGLSLDDQAEYQPQVNGRGYDRTSRSPVSGRPGPGSWIWNQASFAWAFSGSLSLMRKTVSEKTLELNVSAEILDWVRTWNGGADAFWIGMKQYQEARHGLDEVLADMPNGLHLALQFMSPRTRPRDTEPYRCSINDRQNNRLVALARGRPSAVFYVFPNFNSFARIRQEVPFLSNGTVMFPAINAMSVFPARSGRHEWIATRTRPE